MTHEGATNQALANLLLEELAEGQEQHNSILQMVLEEMRRHPAELPPVEVRGEQIDLDALARVLVRAIPKPVVDTALADAIKKLDDRLAEVGSHRVVAGGGGTVTVANKSSDPISISTVSREQRLDYATRTDGNPVYVGEAAPNMPTSSPNWSIRRLTYDETNRPILVQVREAISWDDRGTAF